MDIKGNNKDRLIELHNIISEGVHKVEHIEENINSLFLALMNPEDKRNVSGIQSFLEHIEYIKIPYVMDIRTEVEIYRNAFGKHIEAFFLPKVLHNFTRVIISSRLNTESEALLEWIKDQKKYELYCDKHLHLLKMEILSFRNDILKSHLSNKLIQEIVKGEKDISKLDIYFSLVERYFFNLSQSILSQYFENELFLKDINDYDKKSFYKHDENIQESVVYLINNLVKKYKYTPTGAKEMCKYVIENDLPKKFRVPPRKGIIRI